MELVRLAPADLSTAADLLARAGLSGHAALPFYLSHPDAYVYAASVDGGLAGTGMAFAMQDRRTGWIGNIAVDPDFRGQGLGTALTQHAIQWLRDQGVRTSLLIATTLGRPIYERLGFTAVGEYAVYSGPEQGARPEELGFAHLTPADADALCRLDQAATGEDRGNAVRALLTQYGGWGRWESADLVAYHIPCPWGGGPAVAATPGYAAALVQVQQALHKPGPVAIRTPAENPEAAAALREAGFQPVRTCTRMVLGGAAPTWRPEHIISPINLGLG